MYDPDILVSSILNCVGCLNNQDSITNEMVQVFIISTSHSRAGVGEGYVIPVVQVCHSWTGKLIVKDRKIPIAINSRMGLTSSGRLTLFPRKYVGGPISSMLFALLIQVPGATSDTLMYLCNTFSHHPHLPSFFLWTIIVGCTTHEKGSCRT